MDVDKTYTVTLNDDVRTRTPSIEEKDTSLLRVAKLVRQSDGAPSEIGQRPIWVPVDRQMKPRLWKAVVAALAAAAP